MHHIVIAGKSKHDRCGVKKTSLEDGSSGERPAIILLVPRRVELSQFFEEEEGENSKVKEDDLLSRQLLFLWTGCRSQSSGLADFVRVSVRSRESSMQ